jgi:hypothetical protein
MPQPNAQFASDTTATRRHPATGKQTLPMEAPPRRTNGSGAPFNYCMEIFGTMRKTRGRNFC